MVPFSSLTVVCLVIRRLVSTTHESSGVYYPNFHEEFYFVTKGNLDKCSYFVGIWTLY